ncbi:MAG TPA: GreA/GreB family elongation factor [Burkholderiales bacterium]|nr:GreA/GreB family elongation factor [Burkholderiales bacterium]
MSRAFVKESDDDLVAGELPERPVPAHVNYVTPRGLEMLQARLKELQDRHEGVKRVSEEDSAAKQAMREIDRDLRYVNAQLERAVVVDPAQQPRDEVHFGACVKIEDEEGVVHEFTLVGDDEADVSAGRISWASPLARALMNGKAGDAITWRRPAGETEVEILSIRYPDA